MAPATIDYMDTARRMMHKVIQTNIFSNDRDVSVFYQYEIRTAQGQPFVQVAKGKK